MQIVLVHDSVGAVDAADAQDVLVQAEAVTQALHLLGHNCSSFACTLNLEATLATLQERRAELVFNLVESLAGQGRLIHLLPSCLEAWGIPYTGSSATALFLSSNKILTKQRLQQAGVATPPWIGLHEEGAAAALAHLELGGAWIIKSVWEHASIGMAGDSVLKPHSIDGMAALQALLQKRSRMVAGPFFAEAFIDGREFNLGLLAHADAEAGVEVLPAAEIIFDQFPEGMPKIVDYAAKWDTDSFAYQHTCRHFPGNADSALITRMETIARQCWQTLRLQGYARVDFRVDAAGAPWVLEVNSNPCLAPDAGFAAALAQAGIPFHRAVARIVQAARVEGACTGRLC
ncbi:MAG: D-alanine--D-alanine ligase [Desulfobulbaceae bacterium]|nr:D-alanine--D-alanine ligase [Desulfobulbaceae bacterium]